MSDCTFCKIIAGVLPAKIVHHDELVTAFRDINPQAPTHILIVPNQHLSGVAALTAEHTPALAALFATANQIAAAEGLAGDGYRLVLNQGKIHDHFAQASEFAAARKRIGDDGYAAVMAEKRFAKSFLGSLETT